MARLHKFSWCLLLAIKGHLVFDFSAACLVGFRKSENFLINSKRNIWWVWIFCVNGV